MPAQGVSHRSLIVGAADVLKALPSPVLVIDDAGAIAYANDAAYRLLGDATFSQAPPRDLVGHHGPPTYFEAADELELVRLQLSDGRLIEARSSLLPDGSRVLALSQPETAQSRRADGMVDRTTGLLDRSGFQKELSSLVEAQMPAAAFVLDLDRFKNINDTLGHALGDALLKKVAERLEAVRAPGDILARLGGDEFVLLRPGAVALTEVEAMAHRLVDLIGRTYVLEGQMLNVGASVGVALAPAHGRDANALMKNADLALNHAKAGGKGQFSLFRSEMDARVQARRQIELNLRRALALKQFELLYQPQLELATRQVVGFEALLRWRNCEGESISPATFIPIAEETGLIVGIGEWVLRNACAAAAKWPDAVTVAVNLSPIQFQSAQLVQTVVSALAGSGLDPTRLELEITESALLDDTDVVISTLKSLRKLGVRVSMDDFGTGYSSLSYLQKFPFDKIKIDQSFIREMLGNDEATAIVRAIASLSASLGIKTTAEGVETRAQLEAVQAEGCDHVQGYFTGRPMAAVDAGRLLLAQGRMGADDLA